MKFTFFIFFLIVFSFCTAQVNIIQNGNFSIPDNAWIKSGYFQYDNRFNIYRSTPGYAYLADFSGQPRDNISGQLYQDFFIPQGLNRLSVIFWFRITTTEPNQSQLISDTMRISIIDPTNPSNEFLIKRLSNLDANTTYKFSSSEIPNIESGKLWRIRISAGNNGTSPTVFRLDDFEILANSTPSLSCISWSNGIRPDPLIDTAMNILCSKGIINNIQNASEASAPITRLVMARLIGKALFGNVPIDFMDHFPNIYPEVDNLSIEDKRYVKLMLYLEFGDDVSPYSRDYFHTNLFATINKSDAIKALLESWNLSPFMLYYDPASNGTSPIVCDMPVNNKNLPWVQSAVPLGLLTNIISNPCTGNSIYFGADGYATYGQFYVMLSRLLKINMPSIGYDDLFIPNLYYLNNLNKSSTFEKGVFTEYNDNGFSIPSGGLGLEFSHSYHSNLTEIPILTNDIETHNKYLKVKLQPLGGGWTHSYSMFIIPLDKNGAPPDRILIYWPDGIVHSYLVNENKFETKGVTDKLTIDSIATAGQPGKITIKKGRVIYEFRKIENAYNVLSIVKITDANGNSLNFEYKNGIAEVNGVEPKILFKVSDSYGGRSLSFSYWEGTNYLKAVKDPLDRVLTFYPNQFTHDLDSSRDAMEQVTKYEYKAIAGSVAYRTHLLTSITKPKGNRIENSYYSRKLIQTKSSNYIIQVQAIPDYRSAWNQQTSTVTQIQNQQTIINKFAFDANGNIVKESGITENKQTVYDSEYRPIIQREIDKGFITKTSYDANGYVNKVVLIDSLFNDSIRYIYTNNIYGEIINIIDNNDDAVPTRETQINRDNNGNVQSVIINKNFPTIYQIRHEYNYQSGQLVKYISPSGLQINFFRNEVGNIIQQSKYPKIGSEDILIEKYFYDMASRLIGYINYNGDSIIYQYDKNDNILSSTSDPNGLNLRTINSFDKNDNLVSVLSPKGHLTTLKYDFSTDDLIEENDGNNKKTWKYFEDGTLEVFTSKKNETFNYLYHDKNISPSDSALWGMLYSDGYTTFSYWNKSRSPKFITNTNGKANLYFYNNNFRGKWNRPDAVNTTGFFSNNTPDYVNYNFDRLERLKKIIYPAFNNKDYSYTYFYDQINKNINTVQHSTNFQNYVQYFYRIDGALLKEVYGNGDTVFYHYDSFDRQDSLWAKNKRNTLLYSIGIKLDKNGRHIEENTRIFYQGQEINTIPSLTNGQKQNYSYDLRNRIESGNNRTFTGNGAGEIISITNPTMQYSWNQYGKITSINLNGINTTIEYDALGNRRRLGDIYYIVDQENTGNILMEAQQNTTPISVYIYGRGLISRVDPVTDSIFYYHYDTRGSVIAITNQNGDIVKAYQYDAFGAVYNSVGGLGWRNPFQYLGKHGVETDLPDLYYMKSRYYQPSTGRFLSEDPVWSTNLFIYGNNDPINNIDPQGNIFETALDVVSIGYSSYEFWKKPSLKHGLYLGWDIASAFFPFVPGSYIKRSADFANSAQILNSAAKEISKIKKTGLKYEELMASYLKSKGYDVHLQYNLTKDGGIKLPFNRQRIADIAVFKKGNNGKPLFNVEVKYNTSRYRKSQQVLDEYYEMKTGVKTFLVRFLKEN